MKGLHALIGAAVVLTLAVSLTACVRENYRPSQPQHSILEGPDRSNDWWKTNDDGK